jgi:hypothetical protein
MVYIIFIAPKCFAKYSPGMKEIGDSVVQEKYGVTFDRTDLNSIVWIVSNDALGPRRTQNLLTE